MKTLYSLLFCLASLSGLSAQTTLAQCTDATAEPFGDVFAEVSNEAYIAGVNRSYCITTDNPLASTDQVATISFVENITYPYRAEITDVTSGTPTVVLENFNDAVDIFGEREYFLEIFPFFPGEADIFVNTIGLAQFIFSPQNVTITVESNVPVTWMRPLAYELNNKQLNFTWSVTDQVNVADYSLQKNTGGVWADVATQPASQGRSTEVNYSATDFQGVEDASYRVKQTDFDGQFSFSNITTVPGAGLARKLSVYPNPATELVNFANPVAISGLRLLNLAGRPVRELYNQGTNGTLSLAGLPAGVYLLELTDVNGERVTRRVLRK